MGKHAFYSDENLIEDIVAGYVQNQPWYKKNANTITAAVGTTAVVVSSLLSSDLPLPPWATTLGTVVIGLAAILGVKKTKNGIQPDAGAKLMSNRID